MKAIWNNTVVAESDDTVVVDLPGGEVHPGWRELEVELVDPASGIAPGQACVVYDGTRVVGSATIASTSRVAVP